MQTIADFERTCILRACRKCSMYKNRAKIKRKTRSKALDLVLRFILALSLYIEPAFYVVSENLFCFAIYAITVEFKRGLIIMY